MVNPYVSAKYIDEKIQPVKDLIKLVDEAESNNLASEISDSKANEIAFAFAIIAKEIGVKIPEV